jgi:hypothetical protein
MKMILLYTTLLTLLGLVKFLVSMRTRALERKFVRFAAAVAQLLREQEIRPGNSNKIDPATSAKRTLMLGQLVEKRDRVEAKYFAWQRWTDRLTRWMANATDWKGKKLPYTLGAIDVWMLFGLVDYFGVGDFLSTRSVVETVVAYWSN